MRACLCDPLFVAGAFARILRCDTSLCFCSVFLWMCVHVRAQGLRVDVDVLWCACVFYCVARTSALLLLEEAIISAEDSTLDDTMLCTSSGIFFTGAHAIETDGEGSVPKTA